MQPIYKVAVVLSTKSHFRIKWGGQVRLPYKVAPTDKEAERRMQKMSELYNETGRELYMGAGGREHD